MEKQAEIIADKKENGKKGGVIKSLIITIVVSVFTLTFLIESNIPLFEDLGFYYFLFVFAAFIAFVVLGIIYLVQNRKNKWLGLNSKGFLAAVLYALFIAIVLKYNLFHKLIFNIYEKQFVEISKHEVNENYTGERKGEKAAFFTVNAIRKDNQGGVYLRVYAGPDGIGPDMFSYGFAYKPDLKTSPYGAKGYKLIKMKGDWYSFEASDDWY